MDTIAQRSSHIILNITYTKVFPAKMYTGVLDAIKSRMPLAKSVSQHSADFPFQVFLLNIINFGFT